MKINTAIVSTPDVNTEGFKALGVAVHRASTIVFDDADAYATRGQRGPEGYSYGLYGTPTTRTLEHKLTLLEGGARTFLVSSGQAANAFAALSLLSAGDRILITDACYPPMRDFADQDLARLGVEVGYFDPLSPADLEGRIDGRTRLVWCESPGSTTMEVHDLPAIAAIAKRHGALVGCDNTWATPLNFKPLAHGADIVTEGLTKAISGHSDVLMGSITVKDMALAEPLRRTLGRFGVGVSPDDAALVLRGFETLAVRMRQSRENADALMAILGRHKAVARILHPSVEGSPGHEIWKRDFLGASGVFGVVFAPDASVHAAASLDVLETIAIGASWGGTRSLVAPMPVKAFRSATRWEGPDLVMRFGIGLEAIEDLEADVSALLAEIDRRMSAQ